MSEDIQYAHRFVARHDTPREFARAYLRYAHRTKRQWVFYLLLLMLFTLILISGMDATFSLASRVFWGVIFALVPTFFAAGFCATIGYLRMIRGSRHRLFPGAVLESGFGEEELVYRNPLAEARIRYQAIKTLTARGDFVFMQQHGVPLMGIYPRALFPDHAVVRILEARR